MKRREMLQTLGTAVLAWPLAGRICFAAQKRRKLLFFSRSVLFEHSTVHREDGALSFAEKQFIDLGRQAGWEIDCTKDGDVFDGDLSPYAAIAAYSCGAANDLMKPDGLDGSRPVTANGVRRLREAIRAGAGFLAVHPGILLLPDVIGAGCIGHGAQQVGTMSVVSPRFPGVEKLGPSFSILEEWFALKDFARDLHVILAQDPSGMHKDGPLDQIYDRPTYPATWARMHGKGRVFYTSMGHREDVWTRKIFQSVLLGGLAWCTGDVDVDVSPNIDQVTPQAT